MFGAWVEVCCVFLIDRFCSAVTNVITGTVQFRNYFPWSGMFNHNLSDSASLFVRFDGALGEDFIADLKEERIGSLAVDEFAMRLCVRELEF